MKSSLQLARDLEEDAIENAFIEWKVSKIWKELFIKIFCDVLNVK